MIEETHKVGEIHVHRVPAQGDAHYALVISHGIGAHGGIYNVFCTHHAARGVDIWSYDAPGHGQSTTNRPRGQWTMEEWTQAGISVAEHVKRETGLPVFLLGSSLGVGAAISGVHSDAVAGGIMMGSPVVPGGGAVKMMGEAWRTEAVQNVLAQLGRAARMDVGLLFNFDEDYGYAGAGEQKRLDPWNTWSYDLASWATLFTYDPPVPPEDNVKPVLYAAGENDPSFPPDVIKMAADSIGGPVTLKIFEGASHQLMLFHTSEFSDAVDEFARGVLSSSKE